ncbi:MAG: hypothetical protein AAFX76_03620 [Planctomycetota bacterium]
MRRHASPSLGRRRGVGWTLGVAAVLWVGGCGSPAAVEDDFRITPLPPPTTADDAERIAAEQPTPVLWSTRRLLLPLFSTLEEAWAVTDETVLPDLSRTVWNANGLRVGLLSSDAAASFGEALGPSAETIDGRLLMADRFEALRRSPPLRASFVADLTVPPGPMNRVEFTGGRLQLLISTRDRGNGTAAVTLIPQHARPRASLLPRTAAEKLLDGRVFDELAIELIVAGHQAVVVGLYRPPPPEASTPGAEPPEEDAAIDPSPLGVEEPRAPDVPEAADEDTDPEATDDDLPPLNLGRGLFTTGIEDDDFQLLYVLRPSVRP